MTPTEIATVNDSIAAGNTNKPPEKQTINTLIAKLNNFTNKDREIEFVIVQSDGMLVTARVTDKTAKEMIRMLKVFTS